MRGSLDCASTIAYNWAEIPGKSGVVRSRNTNYVLCIARPPNHSDDLVATVGRHLQALAEARPRKRVDQACTECSKHHRKCERRENETSCARCKKTGIPCIFTGRNGPAQSPEPADQYSDVSPRESAHSWLADEVCYADLHIAPKPDIPSLPTTKPLRTRPVESAILPSTTSSILRLHHHPRWPDTSAARPSPQHVCTAEHNGSRPYDQYHSGQPPIRPSGSNAVVRVLQH